MKKLIIILFLIINIFAFAQKCNYAVNAENLKQTGKFKLLIKNSDDRSFKIPKEIIFCNMRVTKLELYNENIRSFEAFSLAKDIDCFTYKDKSISLKAGQTYIYDVNIKSDFEVLQSRKFFETFNDKNTDLKFHFLSILTMNVEIPILWSRTGSIKTKKHIKNRLIIFK